MDAPMVWVISTDPDTRWLIGLNLTRRGLRIREISAHQQLQPCDGSPQLIILEIDAQIACGWEGAEALRHEPRLRQVPLILISATAPKAGWLRRLLPVRWLEKPLDMDVLLTQVRESLA